MQDLLALAAEGEKIEKGEVPVRLDAGPLQQPARFREGAYQAVEVACLAQRDAAGVPENLAERL